MLMRNAFILGKEEAFSLIPTSFTVQACSAYTPDKPDGDHGEEHKEKDDQVDTSRSLSSVLDSSEDKEVRAETDPFLHLIFFICL